MSGFIPKDDEDIIIIEEETTPKETKHREKGFNINQKKDKTPVNETIVEPVKEVADIKEDEDEAKGFIQGLLGYITNPGFEKKIVQQAQSNGLEPRQVADSFATKILGTISDLFHLALDTIADAFATLISMLAGILIKGGELLIRVFKRLVRIVTLNKTAK